MRIILKKTQRIKAFTLAEILITLLIIGVVSSIVIPALISDTQDAELKAAWKKEYSVLSQVTKLVMMDNGGDMVNLCSELTGPPMNDCLRNLYLEHLSYIKKCNIWDDSGTCFHTSSEINRIIGHKTNDGSDEIGHPRNSKTILNNGVLLEFKLETKTCNWFTWYTPDNKITCGWINVDVNGFNSPNTLGKDIFGIWIQKNGILPRGSDGDAYPVSTDCNESNIGWGCSTKYLYE